MFRYLVLGLLRNHPLHGYALMKEYRNRSGIAISTGNFYRELQRLGVEGLVRTAPNPDGADPRRAPYEITEAGAAAFDEWLCDRSATAIGQYDDELSSRALFIPQIDPALTRKALDQWREDLWLRGKALERTREEARQARADNGQRGFDCLSLLLARRLKHIAADLEFLEEFRSTFEGWLVPPKVQAQAKARAAQSTKAAGRRPKGPGRKR